MPDEAASSTARKKPWLSANAKVRLFWIAAAACLVLPCVLYVAAYRGSLTAVEFTVDRRERVTTGSGDTIQSYYLVWSKEGEVFCVVDSWSFLLWNSSDRYGKLKEGSRVNAKVAGWRIGFLSAYRNIVEIESVESTTP